ncbi:MAG: class I SAM-dependent methyltransferase [bacterium]|nr:class I SAM-dependent methyltransferase [bacterium]
MNEQNNNSTLSFYDVNAKAFAEATQTVDFSKIQDHFLEFLPEHALILDYGCGAGRDSKRFQEKGYLVEAMDGSLEMCKTTEAFANVKVKHMLFQELKEVSRYDGIWACSSILHLPYKELIMVFGLMATALKSGGYVYTSFKYGDFEGERNGRYFTDMTEEKLTKLLQEVNQFQVTDLQVSTDVRPGRDDERWLNIILQKKI